MRYWWVNQNQTYQAEVQGSFMWSPKLKANAQKNPFYETMRAVAPGDVVFSFSDTVIKSIGVITSKAQTGRVTHVDEPRHLKASHIKPWSKSTDEERLDGNNGLLLSPHIDHLFDEGYITFSRNQELVAVSEVRLRLLDAWGIDAGIRVGDFSQEQNAYLEYHRINVYKQGFG